MLVSFVSSECLLYVCLCTHRCVCVSPVSLPCVSLPCVCVQDALVADAGVEMLVRMMMSGGGDAAAEGAVGVCPVPV